MSSRQGPGAHIARYSGSKKNSRSPKAGCSWSSHGGGIAAGERPPLHPVGIAALGEAHHEAVFAMDLGDAPHLDLAGSSAHARTARGAAQTEYPLHRIAVDLRRTCDWQRETTACTHAAFDEFVAGDETQADLCVPQSRPRVGVVVDVRV
ncbi:MAG: hypothetical protein KDJ39_08660 [Gammaproteobacteria bacterium]|nr:hypothetical protein [Gammaproteobacteria bacterium]